MAGLIHWMGVPPGGQRADRAPGIPLAGGVTEAIELDASAVTGFQGFAGEFECLLGGSVDLDIVSLHTGPPVLRERSNRHHGCAKFITLHRAER